jgi:hypothetical protein
MDARWQRVEQIFSAAEGLPKEERRIEENS